MKYSHIFFLLLVIPLLTMCTTETIENYKYKLYKPSDFKEEKQYPLLLFLHGSGERGNDLSKVEVHGPPKMAKGGYNFDAIVVAPQCPPDVYWDVSKLNIMLDSLIDQHNIDTSRIYLTGLSMGGYGTWHWAAANPNRFAAIAPICGGGNPDEAYKLVKTPIWAFHGQQDEVVPASETRDMINALRKVGGKPKITFYPKANHDSWTQTYKLGEFWDWLFSQRR